MTPPPQLKLEDEFRHQRHQRTPSAKDPLLPPPPGYGPPYHYHPYHIGHGTPYYHYPISLPPIAHHYKNTRRQEIPSSDAFDPEDNPMLYPRTREWLQELDMGDRGADGQQWEQYAAALESGGYIRLVQMCLIIFYVHIQGPNSQACLSQ